MTELLDSFGFDAVDAGPLVEGRRFQRDKPAYGPRLTAAELREALAMVWNPEAPGNRLFPVSALDRS